jgi:hypothetical protein
MAFRISYAISDQAAQIREQRAVRAMSKMLWMGILGDHTLFTRRTERGATISADASLVNRCSTYSLQATD